MNLMSAHRVVVTRARADAPALAQALEATGLTVVCIPWLALEELPASALSVDAEALLQARALMVVSAQAAQALARRDVDWGERLRAAWAQRQGPRVWAPGPTTVKALLAAGVPATKIDAPPEDAAQFDSEHLWPQVREQLHAGDRVVFLRGEGAEVTGAGRDGLWRWCTERGAQPVTALVYRRGLPQWSAQERAQFDDCVGDASVCWLASSSMALQQLPALTPWAGAWWRSACVMATHPRIAQTARDMAWARVLQSTPRVADLCATLQQAAAGADAGSAA